MKIESVRDLEVYTLAFTGAMEIFQVTKTFPSEEKYSLTDQIRRSSRSVCSNLAESWRKRRYLLFPKFSTSQFPIFITHNPSCVR